ncbi:hypothetical protein SBOR_7104 [Sclerotinia borealis F-4128]|uniref:Uncharacterized protein n=1 Tax=Sclerotinia borealis (strain F-4128) TaxID=1432307 RepID=W9C6X1_SCLBF|nr:hypothetical protein SBOR_7104 [Sclerotinia borealis F-4128]
MPSIVESISNLFASIINTITAAFSSIIAVLQSILNTILGLINAFFSAIGAAVAGIVQTFEGLFNFLLSNIIVIGALVATFFAYQIYQQRQKGQPITAAPSSAKKTS